MSIRIYISTTTFALSIGAGASHASAQNHTVPAGIFASATPGALQNTRSYDDIATGSIGTARGNQLSVRLPELSTDDGFTPGVARHYGPRGEPLAY